MAAALPFVLRTLSSPAVTSCGTILGPLTMPVHTGVLQRLGGRPKLPPACQQSYLRHSQTTCVQDGCGDCEAGKDFNTCTDPLLILAHMCYGGRVASGCAGSVGWGGGQLGALHRAAA